MWKAQAMHSSHSRAIEASQLTIRTHASMLRIAFDLSAVAGVACLLLGLGPTSRHIGWLRNHNTRHLKPPKVRGLGTPTFMYVMIRVRLWSPTAQGSQTSLGLLLRQGWGKREPAAVRPTVPKAKGEIRASSGCLWRKDCSNFKISIISLSTPRPVMK